jgi:hypothetical protein
VNTKLHNLAVAHFNEPIISFEEVVRLIGYAEDERDCYFITQRMHGEIRWNTCVGGYVFLDRLAGQGRVVPSASDAAGVWDDLWRLDNTLHLNGAPRQGKFLLEIKE